MDAATLGRAMGNVAGVNYAALAPAFNEAMLRADITTINRAAMWCAQLGHESVGLKYMREIWGPSAAQRGYEGRRDLGNTQPGDGYRYLGRGPIQITGRSNYANLSRWAHGKGYVPTPTFFVDNPVALEQPEHGFLGAVWYWTVARPQLNQLADNKWIHDATRAINGGTNGIEDRIARWNRCLGMGAALLPEKIEKGPVMEKVLAYKRDQILQDTDWNCGPATAQTIIHARRGEGFVPEGELARALGTHTGGTDWIGQFPAVLNRYIGGDYRVVEMPNDPPTVAQRERLWNDVRNSIDAGYGVVANIVAPSSNYPRAVPPSTRSPAYGGGTVYHYFAIMGYSDDGGRRYWIADSGFPGVHGVTGYWISHDQLATLIPPKGYAYATVKPAQPQPEDDMFTDKDREMLERVHHELTYRFQSRYVDPETGKQSAFRETLVGFILQLDEKMETMNAVRLPGLQKAVDAVLGLLGKGK